MIRESITIGFANRFANDPQETARGKPSNRTIKTESKPKRKSGPPQRKLGCIGSNADKFDKVDIDALVEDIAAGVPLAIAAGAQGITARTVENWLDSRVEFAERLARAKRAVILKALDAIQACGTKEREFRHQAWFLETVYRDYFTPPDKGFHFTQNNLMLGGDLDEARRILDAAKALPYRSENNERQP